MHRLKHYGLLFAGCAFLLAALAGCFQTAGESLPAQEVADAFITFTPPGVLPTETVEAQDIDEALTPTEDLIPLLPPETPTLDIFAVTPTETLTPTIDIFAVTDTPQPIAQLSTPTPETNEFPSVSGQEATLDPNEVLATQIIETATAQAGLIQTATAQSLTATAEAFFTPFVPDTPIPDPGQGGGIFFTATPFPPGLTGQDCIHTVQLADRNLYRIALYYGSTVEAIAAASGKTNINLIRPGEQLIIPGCGTLGRPPQQPGQPGIPGGNYGNWAGQYVVRTGDTLFRLSLTFGVTVNDLVAANGIRNPNYIQIGQVLRVP